MPLSPLLPSPASTTHSDVGLKKTRAQLIIGVAIATFLTGAIVATITGQILFQGHIDAGDSALQNEVRMRAKTVEIFAQHIVDVSAQIASRSGARDTLLHYKNGRATLDDTLKLTAPILEDSLRSTPSIHSIVRLAHDGKAVALVGGPPPKKIWQNLRELRSGSQTRGPVISSAINVGGRFLIPVYNTVRDRASEPIGTDLIFYRSDVLRESLAADHTGLPETRQLILAEFYDGQFHTVLPSPYSSANASLKAMIDKVLFDAFALGVHIAPQSTPQGKYRTSAAPIARTNWALAEWVPTRSLYGSMTDTIGPVMLTLMLLVSLCSGLAAYALRPFAGKILVHADAFAAEVEAKTAAMAERVRLLREAEAEVRVARDEAEKLVQTQTSALAKANAHLQVEVADKSQLLAALTEAKARAERANNAKSEWIALISHEIRNPLSVVIGHAELLASESQLPPHATQSIHAIQRSSSHLLDTVNDLLDISKLEAGKLDLNKSRVRLDDIADDVTASLKFSALQKGIQLEVIKTGLLPDTIFTDPKRLRQILLNIVGNAVKFTDKGSVRVEIRNLAAGGDHIYNQLEIRVTDTGRGVSLEEATQLFKPYGQACAGISKKFGGTGLGLVLSRSLAKALGGDLVLESSQPGVGSVFTVTIDSGVTLFPASQGPALKKVPLTNGSGPDAKGHSLS